MSKFYTMFSSASSSRFFLVLLSVFTLLAHTVYAAEEEEYPEAPMNPLQAASWGEDAMSPDETLVGAAAAAATEDAEGDAVVALALADQREKEAAQERKALREMKNSLEREEGFREDYLHVPYVTREFNFSFPHFVIFFIGFSDLGFDAFRSRNSLFSYATDEDREREESRVSVIGIANTDTTDLLCANYPMEEVAKGVHFISMYLDIEYLLEGKWRNFKCNIKPASDRSVEVDALSLQFMWTGEGFTKEYALGKYPEITGKKLALVGAAGGVPGDKTAPKFCISKQHDKTIKVKKEKKKKSRKKK